MYNNYNNPGYYKMNGVYSNNEFYPEAGSEEDRFFLAPLVVGGLAGTALGYGIANNNQMNNGMPCCPQPIMVYPTPIYNQQYPQQPMISSTSSNNYYY